MINEQSKTDIAKKALEKKNSLLERSRAAKWVHDSFMTKMDNYAFLRGMILFTLQAFFLGNNLGIFLWLHVIVTTYLTIYRAARFWVKRWLMYLIEFCYFGSYALIAYVVCYTDSDLFKIAYVSGTGVMSLAVIVFNNQAQFNSTDHLTSSYLHTIPLITSWAIRWRHRIYSHSDTERWGIQLNNFEGVSFSLDDDFFKLVYLPILFWLGWAVCYYILTTTVLNKYIVRSDVYGSGVADFMREKTPIRHLLGDLTKHTQLKYLIQHFVFFVVGMPLAILCFYCFEVNCVYILTILVFLGWNTGRNNLKHIQRKVEKAEIMQQDVKTNHCD
jgi:hypothetical protein